MLFHRIITRALEFLLLVGACSSPAAGAGIARHGVFVYSNLCIETESGDTAGNRITLLRFPEGDSLLYETASGVLGLPILADDLKIDEIGGHISFKVSPPGELMTVVNGDISKSGKMVLLHRDWCASSDAKVELAAIRNFSRTMKQCPPCPKN